MAGKRKTIRWWILGGLVIFVLSALSDSDDAEVPRATGPSVVTTAPATSTAGATARPTSRPIERVQGLEPGYVNATSLNVRARPDSAGQILFKVPRGTKIVPVSRVDRWLEVQLNDGSTAWVSADFVLPGEPAAAVTMPTPAPQELRTPAPAPKMDRNKIVQAIIEQSAASTGGRCACPWNTDRAGRRCGARSAYSKPGGASPICYPEQVTEAMITRFIAQN